MAKFLTIVISLCLLMGCSNSKKISQPIIISKNEQPLNFNQTVNLKPGQNKIPVKIIGYSGDETERFIEIQTEK